MKPATASSSARLDLGTGQAQLDQGVGEGQQAVDITDTDRSGWDVDPRPAGVLDRHVRLRGARQIGGRHQLLDVPAMRLGRAHVTDGTQPLPRHPLQTEILSRDPDDALLEPLDLLGIARDQRLVAGSGVTIPSSGAAAMASSTA
jgi:hypothetical protein